MRSSRILKGLAERYELDRVTENQKWISLRGHNLDVEDLQRMDCGVEDDVSQ